MTWSGRLGSQRRQRLALEAEVAVDPVLDDEEAVAPGELDEALAPLRREVAAGRVVEARLDGEHADLVAAQQLLERVDVEPVVVDRDRQDAGAGAADGVDHAEEARRLAGDDVAGAQDRAGDERERLAGAGGD